MSESKKKKAANKKSSNAAKQSKKAKKTATLKTAARKSTAAGTKKKSKSIVKNVSEAAVSTVATIAVRNDEPEGGLAADLTFNGDQDTPEGSTAPAKAVVSAWQPTIGLATNRPELASLLTGEHEFVNFTLAGQIYGLPVEQVIEVVRIVAITEVPEAPQGMLGVINFHGEVIPLISLREVFGLPWRDLELNTPVLVTSTAERLFGLLVDEVNDVGALSGEMQTNVEEISIDVRYLLAVTRMEEDLLLVIDLTTLHARFPARIVEDLIGLPAAASQ